MKRSFAPAFGSALLAFCLAAPALAEVVIYDPAGGGPTPALQYLAFEGGGYNNALAPTNSGPPAPELAKSPSVSGGSETAPTNSVTLLSGSPIWVLGAVNFRDTDPVSFNQVFITGGNASTEVCGAFHQLQNGETQALNNHVIVNGGTADLWVTGGQAYNRASGNATASNNTVTISDGSAGGIRSGYGYTPQAGGGNATANSNAVTISGGTVGTVISGYIFGPSGGNAIASNNTVEIWDGVVRTSVIGGQTPVSAVSSIASNNTVKISAAPPTLNLTTAQIYGGYATGATASSTGNSLEIAAAAVGVTVNTVAYFQKLHFELPPSLAPNAAMLTVTGAGASRGLYLGTDALVSVSAPGLLVNTGDTFTLIDATGATVFSGTAVTAPGSTLNGYTYTVERNADMLLLIIGPASGPTPSATAIPATGIGVLAALGLLLAGLGFAALRRRT
ncbi:MAG: hypothetical protein LBE15_03195 [Burkholderiales bacterium]|jgi:hypothetical protein|nr:hypothetical protein [Burkholderiales bacterium]